MSFFLAFVVLAAIAAVVPLTFSEVAHDRSTRPPRSHPRDQFEPRF